MCAVANARAIFRFNAVYYTILGMHQFRSDQKMRNKTDEQTNWRYNDADGVYSALSWWIFVIRRRLCAKAFDYYDYIGSGWKNKCTHEQCDDALWLKCDSSSGHIYIYSPSHRSNYVCPIRTSKFIRNNAKCSTNSSSLFATPPQ